jgi:hypothetical protein
MKRACFWLSLLLLGFVSIARADLTDTNNGAVPAAQTPLVPLIRFVLKEGKPDNAETYLVQNLNLGHQDIPVIEKGWGSGDGMDHLVAVSTTNQDDVLIFLFNKNIDGVCWLTSKSGKVRSTVAFSRSTHTSRVIPNELDVKAFEHEKKFLLGKIYAADHKRQ